MIPKWIRETHDDKVAGVIRVSLGVPFLMTGVMKLAVPMLGDAFSRQLLAANLPFYALTVRLVPVAEIAVGALLSIGAFARLGGLIVIGMMAVATYVHIVVDDPTAFPLQPSEPIIPLVVIAMSAYVLWRGGGAWSLDLRATQAAS
jgi:uncharacterized membrane protein YphA (DoxX/SURF4 family)